MVIFYQNGCHLQLEGLTCATTRLQSVMKIWETENYRRQLSVFKLEKINETEGLCLRILTNTDT